MAQEEPVVRGRHMKALLAAVQGWPFGDRAVAHLRPETRDAISAAGGLDWLPVALNLELTQATYDGLGAVEADRLFHAHTRASFDGPILQTMVITGVRILGLDPVSFCRWVPKGWHMIFREVGVWTVEPPPPGASSVLLTLGALPPACAAHPVWLRSVARSLDALLDLAQVRGEVELLPGAGAECSAQFRMRWTASAAARPPAA